MTAFAFEVEIPGQPPSINRSTELHLIGGIRQRAWSKAFYLYRDMVSVLVSQAKPRDWELPDYMPAAGAGMLVIEIKLYLKRDMDCDNVLKALLDGVKVGLGTKVVTGRHGPRIVPIYDDAGFLPRFMWKQTGMREPEVRLKIDWA